MLETGAIASAKTASVLPTGTVTVAGTVTAGLVLLKLTTTPPGGAEAVRTTLPSAAPQPPTTAPGVSDSDRIAGVGRGVLLRKIERRGEEALKTTTSGKPSPLKSPTCTSSALSPEPATVMGTRKLPAS